MFFKRIAYHIAKSPQKIVNHKQTILGVVEKINQSSQYDIIN